MKADARQRDQGKQRHGELLRHRDTHRRVRHRRRGRRGIATRGPGLQTSFAGTLTAKTVWPVSVVPAAATAVTVNEPDAPAAYAGFTLYVTPATGLSVKRTRCRAGRCTDRRGNARRAVQLRGNGHFELGLGALGDREPFIGRGGDGEVAGVAHGVGGLDVVA